MHNESLKYLRCIAGNYYFVRRIPRDVSYHYSSDRISISLKTKSYNKASTNSNSASNGLNKWMKEHIEPQYVLHGFRHAMRDRLREVDCPSDVMDEIGGWSKTSVGQTYGQGSSLERLHRYMEKVVIKTEM